MSQAFVDQVTLDCLLNKSLFNNQVKHKKAQSINKEERKFYKKRIYNLFKELLINKAEPEDLLPDVKYAYNNFLNASINYFKTIDNNDLLQEEYKTLHDEERININTRPVLSHVFIVLYFNLLSTIISTAKNTKAPGIIQVQSTLLLLQ